jgi:hypothetical protein
MNSNAGDIINDQVTYSLQSNHTIQLPKEFRLEMNFLYRGPAASGLYHMAAMSRLDIGVRKSFFKKKIDFSVNVSDVYKGYQFLWSATIPGQVNDFDQYLRFRNIGATLRYNFSKGQKVEIKKRAVVEEINRT